jgi:hypothetical protein
MKNIHVLPTDKPSRLRYFDSKLEIMWLIPKKSDIVFQHIYITSDEEIKDGDWMIRGNEQPTLVTPNFFWDFGVRYYKIILTTDQDLIRDGVQAITDEFLEWFVKNPSCEEVEVEKDEFYSKKAFIEGKDAITFKYEIIIPKKEPKQFIDCKCTNALQAENCTRNCGHGEEPKQETLEEAAERTYPINNTGSMFMPTTHESNNNFKQKGFIAGAKSDAAREYWFEKFQQEQDKNMYSEDGVFNLWNWLNDGFIIRKSLPTKEELLGWFKQFKKK